ncbi:PLP-dependent aminotransferase family protein [Loigolactobacillus backii]|uniref:GntR family transcriptional regulator n=1 Tax=Loigolactobacillus backii TaxID=375175 RepID=A0A192H3F3_9LACO|nr:PLP-dependent aminotransferase family protein [Loigolactobacillus backii]ANK62900.1 GntR family transcriptional regulator [Loigolactobacillus backii]ANK70092.1 GntR family transcriptional regulator [Loigolactobacillus backii]MDA5387074.1 PLP-dependent aminotransferase family protein [Loigolactobacillus backii]MDA5389611.1 PLP-dependent aminotransferase family protein [Loigolactobacillus backii]PIO83450.1 GntR family transcriptional regulator [Loigolactobacillus backii]
MHWQLPTGSQPAYLRLINFIRHSLEIGALLPGQQLPPERQLAATLAVSRSTVRRTFDELVSQGILVRKVGSGTWVNTEKWGVLPNSINWQSYLTADRLADPTQYMAQLQVLLDQKKGLNLAQATLPAALLAKSPLPAMTWQTVLTQEAHLAISGAPKLKKQLQLFLGQHLRQNVVTSQILITSGAQQAFFLITQGLLAAGDAIAVEQPSYFYQLGLFQAAGIRIFGVPLRSDGSLDLAVLRQLYYQHHVRFIFVNPTGQNPTGCTMPLSARQALIQLCAELKLPIVEDDPLALLQRAANVLVPPLKALDPENVLYVGTLSTLTGPNTRIGWLVAPSQIVQRLADIRQQLDSGLSIFPQLVATGLLADPDLTVYLQQLQQQLKQKKEQLQRLLLPLQQQHKISFQLPQIGYNLWLKLHIGRQLTPSDYTVFLKNGLLVLPGFLFGLQENTIRVSFAQLTPEQAVVLVQRLTKCLTLLADD